MHEHAPNLMLMCKMVALSRAKSSRSYSALHIHLLPPPGAPPKASSLSKEKHRHLQPHPPEHHLPAHDLGIKQQICFPRSSSRAESSHRRKTNFTTKVT